MEIRSLREEDDRSPFQSGEPDLDRFFHKFAGQNQFRHQLGTTCVAVDDDRILGYATVSAGHLEIEDLPASRLKRLPRYPLPISRLARLAVASPAQGKGVGSELLRYVFSLALRMAKDLRCVGVAVDARPQAVGFYRRLGFVELELREGQSGARPMLTPMFLPLADVQTAME